MKGNFKSIDSKMSIMVSVLFFGILPLFCLAAKSDAAIIIIAVAPMMIGIVPLIYTMNVPCTYDADEKCLRIKKGHDERTFRYADIQQIFCKYVRNEGGRAIAELTILNSSGEISTYRENFNMDMAELLNDPGNTKKPQLFQLCDYVNSVKGAAV